MKNKILLIICLIIFIVSIAGVSAAEINQTDDTNSADTLSVSLSDGEITGVDNGTFTDLQKKIDDADEGAIINLENNYTYDSTTQINIHKSLTINGNGYVIDALGQSRIFYITSPSITLNNITFKNGYARDGGAIYFENSVSNSTIFGVFVNNSAQGYSFSGGGAIYFKNSVSNSTISGVFVNNSVYGNVYNCGGGAIYFDNGASNFTVYGLFVNNSAIEGGAIYFLGSVSNFTVSGEFVNNSGRGAICSYSGDFVNFKIINSIFLLNKYNLNNCNNAIFENCWFGNNASNYESKSYSNCESWLFLDGVSSPVIGVNGKSSVTFTLDNLYNSSSKMITHPDVSGLPDVVFELSAVNGYLNKYTARPGESVIFTSTVEEDGIVKAMYNGVSYSIKIVNLKVDAPDVNKYYNGSEEFVVTLTNNANNPVSDVNVSVTINGKTVSGLSDSNGIFSVPLDLNPGNYTVTTTASGIKVLSTVNIYSTVESSDINAIYKNVTFEATILDSTGKAVAGRVVEFNIGGLKQNGTSDENGFVSVGIDLGVGNYIITTTNPVTGENKTNKVIISKASSSVSIGSEAFGDRATLTADITGPGIISGEVVFTINGNTYYTRNVNNSKASITLINLDVGNYTAKAVYNGDVNHNSSVSDVITFYVGGYNYVISAPDVTKDYHGSERFNVTLTNNNVPVGGASVKISINGSDYTRITDGDGKISMDISDLDAAVYGVVVKYGDVTVNSVIMVNQLNTKTNLSITKNSLDSVTLTAVIDSSYASGEVLFTVNDDEYSENVTDSKAVLTLSDLDFGNYTVKAVYKGDVNHKTSESASMVFNIDDSIKVSAPDVVKYFHGSERFVVNVCDGKGIGIANKTVVININGATYTRSTDDKGNASIALGLGAGVYNVTSTVDNMTVNSTVSILTTVNGTDVVKIFRNGTQYYATFKDSKGNYLADGTTVRFNINGVFYDRQVSGDKGLARLNLNLVQGEYILTAINLETGEQSGNLITVIPKIVENRNVTKYFRNATQYSVKVLDDAGNPVGAGKEVTFNINGVLYKRSTDENGTAKMNINLNPGEYVITAEYGGCVVSNTIKILPTLIASDLTKKYGSSDPFVVTVVDGQGSPLANQTVRFNINGVFYDRTTNATGQAKLNINLVQGIYIITSSYGDAVISNTVTVKP